MTTMTKYRAFDLVLLLAYAIDYALPPSVVKDVLRRVSNGDELWIVGLCTLSSVAVVTIALGLLAFASTRLTPNAIRRLRKFLIAYWLPHTLLVGFWMLLYFPTDWVD